MTFVCICNLKKTKEQLVDNYQRQETIIEKNNYLEMKIAKKIGYISSFLEKRMLHPYLKVTFEI
jgi:hypothetical protein